MNHVIDHNDHYTGHITVIPPRNEALAMAYGGGVVSLIRYNMLLHKRVGSHPIAGQDNESLEDTFHQKGKLFSDKPHLNN